jgi:hypothetical protein
MMRHTGIYRKADFQGGSALWRGLEFEGDRKLVGLANIETREQPLMEPVLFDRAYYLSRENTWLRFRLLAYEDVGKLTISEASVMFESSKRTVVIDRIQQVSYGKQGRDFVNNWVKIEYLDGGRPALAFFADGGSLGWSGVAGGTAKMLEAIKRIPPVGRT